MITTLEERKAKLLSQIEQLEKEIDILKWLEYKELALYRYTGSVGYLDFDRL